MNRPDIDLAFGRGRLRMASGDHVEVFREASQAGERRRYGKRFLATEAGDFRHWTEREARILTRLASLGVAHVARVERLERGGEGHPAVLRSFDAGVTVDRWASLSVQHGGGPHRHVFEDCAHWWSLARHGLIALEAIHEAGLVHLGVQADNICIPFSPAEFDPGLPGELVSLCFEQLALIDFAFALAPGERLEEPPPMTRQWQHPTQSPRLIAALEAARQGELAPLQQLDWRCDLFSLAALLRRLLPGPDASSRAGWTPWHLTQAGALIWQLLEAHDAEPSASKPHRALLELPKQVLADAGVVASIGQGWTLAAPGPSDAAGADPADSSITIDGLVGLPSPEPERVALSASIAARASLGRAGRGPGWIALAAIGVPVLAGAWWMMAPPAPNDQRVDTAQAVRADAASAAPLSPAALPASGPASEPVPAPAAPLPTEPPLAAATPSASVPVEPEPVPVAAKAASDPGAQPPPPPASHRGRPAAPRRAATETPGGQMAVNEAERERALEWLTRRGPSPRPGMRMPPAPSPASAPAAAANPEETDQPP